jgi:predicted nucleic acid-binding protein
MTLRYGTDTSVLVRLITGLPETEYRRCHEELTRMVEQENVELFASNQVIGEAYIALQHHYGLSKAAARATLRDVLRSGLVAPLNGRSIFAILDADGGPGLLDRLIADDYARADHEVLTLDRKMAALPGVRRL